MRRRDFTGGMGAMLVSAGVARPAIADIGGPAPLSEPMAELTRVRLLIAGAWILLSWIILTDRRRFLGIPLDRPMPTFAEDRRDLLGRTPLAEYRRQPFADRYANAQPLGSAQLSGSRLFVHSAHTDSLSGRGLTFGTRTTSWDITPRLVELRPIEGLPYDNRGQLRGAPVVGELRQESDRHLLLGIGLSAAF